MKKRLSTAVIVSMAAFTISPVYGALGGRAGQTELQSNTGTSVQTVCGSFASGSPTPAAGLETELFNRCREMVHSANDIDGSGATADSLGLTEDELNAGIQQLAGEEAVAVGSMATETSYGQAANIGARMAALRSGAAGFRTGASGMFDETYFASAADAWPARGEAGGAAGEGGDGRLSGYVKGRIGTGEKDATANEDGFEFDNNNITAGADYRFTNNFVAGAALGYTTFDSDFDKTNASTVNGGSIEADGYSLSAYGTYYRENVYFEGVISFSANDLESDRKVVYPTQNRTASADTESEQWLLSVGVGYELEQKGLSYGPYGRLTMSRTEVDGYEETGAAELNLSVDSQDIDSTRSIIGIQVSKAMSRAGGVLVPQAWVEWNHEFDDDARVVKTTYVNDPNQFVLEVGTDESDSDFFTLGLGVSGVFPGGTQGFLSYETVLGLEDISEHMVTLGLRREF